jgi:hypothetical protein
MVSDRHVTSKGRLALRMGPSVLPGRRV